MKLLFRSLLVFTAIASSVHAAASDSSLSSWPAGAAPSEVGARIAARFIAVPHQNFGRPGRPERITYPEVCTWYGALTFADVTKDEKLRTALVQRFEPLLAPVRGAAAAGASGRSTLDERDLVPVPDHVDHTVFAAVPLEIYLQTKDQRCLDLGRTMADWQWAKDPSYHWPMNHPVLQKYFPNRQGPRAQEWIEQGYTWQTRLWIDDMFMITMAQAQAYRATGDVSYINRAAREMVLYLDRLQKPNGLFFHAPETPFYWARGNGWMAAGTAELLRSLPHDNPDRARILEGYRRMMAGLLAHQDAQGMWHQLIDDPQAWPETSGTGMFAFAFITGVKHGWLDAKTYSPAARKAWLALITYIDANHDVREVCQGTNIHDPKSHGPDGRAYYLGRERIAGDMHGQAPVLWCAAALLRP